MITHIKEKYGFEPKVLFHIMKNADNSRDEWRCALPGAEDDAEYFTVFRREDGTFMDNYFLMSCRDDITSKVEAELAKCALEHKVFLRTTTAFADEKYTSKNQVEDYIQAVRHKEERDFFFHIFLRDTKDTEKNMQNLEAAKEAVKAADLGTVTAYIYCAFDKFFDSFTYANETATARIDGEKVYDVKFFGELER